MKKKDIFIASLDISNAFGSLPHWVIFEALRLAGAGDEFIDIIRDAYEGAETTYRTSSGTSTSRAATIGVKQGDPLSGLLFVLAIDFILRKIQSEGIKRNVALRELFHYVLAYADDLIIMAKNAVDLQALLNLVVKLSNLIQLKFNTNKCKTMHFSSKAPADCRGTRFMMNSEPVPFIMDGTAINFLGKPIGHLFPKDTVTIENIKQRAIKILTSQLAPWQRIDCMKTFFYPSLMFMMRMDIFNKSEWAAVDDVIKPLVKKILGLPSHAANEYLYGYLDNGLFAIPVAAEDSDIAHIDGLAGFARQRAPTFYRGLK